MPKMKTNRGAAKRFKKTASGGFKRGHAFHSHILTKKDQKRKRGLRGTGLDRLGGHLFRRQGPLPETSEKLCDVLTNVCDVLTKTLCDVLVV